MFVPLAQSLPAAQRGHEELDANLVLLRDRGQHPADLAERALAHGLVADGDLLICYSVMCNKIYVHVHTSWAI